MRYARMVFVLCLLATTAFAAPPKFSGEIWAGSEVIPNDGLVNVYWVFDGGVFNEYIYYYATDELRLMASGRYTACASQGKTTYTLNFTVAVRVPSGPAKDDGARPFTVQMKPIQVPLTQADGSLTLPRGDRLSRVESFTQFVPPIEHVDSAPIGKLKPAPTGCCGACYAVHDFLGISFLNGICCLGSCGFMFDGGESGGGGGGGNW